MSGSCGWFPMRRDEIVDWVKAHERELPTTLAELAAFPVPFRKVIVTSISPALRTTFWGEHLATFVSDESDLSPEQKAFVSASSIQLPALLANPAPNPTMSAWEADAARLFARPEMARIFGTLGPPEPPEGLPLPPGAHPSRV
jgi:hypothetical protein